MADDAYLSFVLDWEDRQITVSYQIAWLNSDHIHVELRCPEPLPVTETGYRSMFFPEGTFSDADDIRDHILTLPVIAADTPAWRNFREDERQLNLF